MASEYDRLANIPMRVYLKALCELPLTENSRKMLTYHFRARRRTVTPAQMAKALWKTTYGTADLHYGRLARRIRELAKVRLPKRRYQVEFIAKFEYPKSKGSICHWAMRPAFAEALRRIGIR